MPLLKQSKEIIFKFFAFIKKFYETHKTSFVVIVAVMIIAGCVVTYFSVEMTSTVAFCTSCHEMKPAHDSYLESSHYNVKQGKKAATCRDCHLPPWNHPIQLLFEKAYHGAKDVTGHFTEAEEFDQPGFYFDMKTHADKTIHNYNCLKCHKDLFKKQYDGYDNIHKGLKSNPSFSCVKCHREVVHKTYLPK